MNMNSATFVSDVRDAAIGHWPEVLATLGIEVPRGGKHGPCPVCGGNDPFRMDDKGGRGTWICNRCGADDGIALVSRVAGKPVKEAAALVAGALGLSHVDISEAERAQRQQQQRAKDKEAARKKEDGYKRAAKRAERIMNAHSLGGSAYLSRKGFAGRQSAISNSEETIYGEVFPVGSLIVPLLDSAGALVNVELIRNEDGLKYALAGGRKAGVYNRIDGGTDVAVVEGYATGLSVHLATGATIYCAMTANNLMNVAKIARSQHPDSQIFICGDHDLDKATAQRNESTKRQAEQAALAAGGRVIFPPEAGDWNDYHQAHGLTAARDEIMRQIEQTQEQDASQKEAPSADVIPLHQGQATSREEQAEESEESGAERAKLPEGFVLGKDTLFAKVLVGKGDDAREEYIPISSPIFVLAETSAEDGVGHGRLLEWRDSRGNVRRWAMPLRMLVARGGDEVFSALLDSGASFINLGKKQHLRDYLMACKPTRRITCVERTGWHGNAYVLPKDSIGPDAKNVILQTTGYAGSDFTQAGTLAEWQHEIAAMAIGNSRLCFALSMAFAAPLLSLVGMEGGGFHLKGESTDGKTTIMKAAASVYGAANFSHTWRATGNAIEGIANRRNDALLCLDEIGEQAGSEVGKTAYMLANGQGKGRAQQNGDLRERKAWRLLFLSTGELSLEDHASEDGKRTQAGMEIRTLQIPSDTGKHGAFEQLHGLADGRTFADTLKDSTERHYGTAFRSYVQALASDLSRYRSIAKTEIKRLAEELTPKQAGNQVGRAINRFALVAAAGELASELGITGWPAGEATKAAKVCLTAWLTERGHLGNQEDAATLRQIRQFFSGGQFSKFADWYDHKHRPNEMVGYRRGPRAPGEEAEGEAECTKGVLFYVLPEGWKKITEGRDHKKAARLAFEAGWLAEIPKGSGGKLQVTKRIPGGSTAKVYVFGYGVIAAGQDEGEDE